MNKSENTLLIWVLSWSSVILAILYSPIGSPDFYKKRSYCAENQGVNFRGTSVSRGAKEFGSIKSKVSSVKGSVAHVRSNIASLKSIKNSPKGRGSNSGQDAELNIPNDSLSRKKGINYPTGGSGSSFNNRTTYSASVTSTKENIASSGSGSSGGSGGNGFYSGSRNSNAGNGGQPIAQRISQNPGVTTSGVDMTIFNDSTSMLASNQAQRAPGDPIDPGFDPTGEPVPVPEAWGFLILLVLAYSYYIYNKNKKNKCVFS